MKYVVIGLVCLALAIGLWLAASQSKPPAPPPAAPPPEVARVNPMEQQLDLEEQKVPDAGAPAAPPEEEAAKRPSTPARKGNTEWECSGDLPGALGVVRSNSAQVRSCYERRLKMNNLLQGDVRLKLKVGAGGKVVATQLSGSLHDAEVLSCMRNLAQSWTFPVPSGGSCAVVQVPFQFSPKQ
jgi:outer membrane biosynthesis protein TonB